jgi:putative spermidine/putrescine transport system permease protein
MAQLPPEQTEKSIQEGKNRVEGLLTGIAGMFKYLSPRRFYYAVGKTKFYEFVIFSVFLLLFYGPLLNTLMLAFGDVYRFPDVLPQQWGFQWWQNVLREDMLVQSIVNAFVIAFLSTGISLIICLPTAYALARYEFRGKQIIMFSFLFSNAFPKIGLYTSIGIVFYRMNLMGTLPGVLVIHIINTLMFMVWLPSGAFRSIHRQQEEAARDVGAGPFTTFRKITLPLAAPGIAVATIYTFLGSLDEAQGTLFVGFPQIQTMATAMYSIISQRPIQFGAVFSIILMVPSAIVLVLFRKYIGPKALSKGIKIK